MNFFERLLIKLRFRRESGLHEYQMDERLHNLIEQMAEKEQRPEQDITARLLESALSQHNRMQDLWNRWQSLSRREQEVAASACLGYTNIEIATRLGVSQTTIKTHIRNILIKFEMHGKSELRIALQEWDFSEWERPPYR